MNYIIEKFKPEHLKQLENILKKDFDEFWNFDILKNEVLSNNSEYIVAMYKNEIVGFAGIKIVFDQADIMNIVTKKSYRKNGIGTMLLNALINLCITLKISSIMLEVNENNLEAINLYKKFNFEPISIRKNYYKNENALIMKKSINSQMK